MSDKKLTRKLLRLPSVGEWLDLENHDLYKEDESGNPDLSPFLPKRLVDALNDEEWCRTISLDDARRLNRNIGL